MSLLFIKYLFSTIETKSKQKEDNKPTNSLKKRKANNKNDKKIKPNNK